MIYECDQCQSALSPNETCCSKCGEVFEEPVPADAVLPKRGFKAVSEDTRDITKDSSPSQDAAIFSPSTMSSQKAYPANPWNQNVSGRKLLGMIILVGLGLLAFNRVFHNEKPVPSLATIPANAVSSSSNPPSSEPADQDTNASAPPDNITQLAKDSEHFSKESDFDVVTGEITNVGQEKIANLEATTTFYDNNGSVVKTADAMVDFNPLMPGQTSPYKTMEIDNPLIKTEKTEFHSMGGPLIPYSLVSKRRTDASDDSGNRSIGSSDSARDPVSETAALGSGLSDRPLKLNLLRNATLTESDLRGKSLAALSVSYNTIYAVHGYIFKRKSLQNTFNKMSWYHPNSSFAETDINRRERQNLATIRSYERKVYHY